VADARGKLARLAGRLNATGLPRLVLMTDDERLPDPRAAAIGLPHGSLVVLRAKERTRRLELAAMLAGIARKRELLLLIAGDPELATRLGADGVHFPESRANLVAHWRALRPRWLITASAHSLDAVARSQHLGADAVFLSPVFPTKSHPDRKALSPVRVRLMSGLVRVPIYVLGGIDAGSARRLAGGKFAGFAAIGALAD
jgi:thiamine-phosphate pyrophosphorylase